MSRPDRPSSHGSLAVLVVALATACAIPAQGLTAWPDACLQHRSWKPEVATDGSFGYATSGLLTGNGVPDVVTMRGDRAFLVTAPGVHESVQLLPMLGADQSVSAIAVVPRPTSAVCDTLLLAGPSGLRAWRFTPSATPIVPTPILLQAGAWIGARNLRVLTRDASGARRVVGSNATGSLLLWADLDGPRTHVIASGSIDLGAPVVALEPLDWNDDGNEDLVVVTATGMRVLQRIVDHGIETLVDLVSPTPYLWPATSACMARVDVGAREHDIAIVVPKLPGQDAGSWFFLFGATRFEILDLGSVVVRGIASGDTDGDGCSDLLLTTNRNSVAYTLKNARGIVPSSPATFSFTPGWAFSLATAPESVPAAPSSAWPVLADMDADGDVDLVMPVENPGLPTCLLAFATNSRISAASPVAITNGGYYVVVDPITAETTSVQSRFDLDWSAVGAPFTHVEVTVWRSLPNLAGLVRTAVTRFYIPVGNVEHSFRFDSTWAFVRDGGTHDLVIRPVVAAGGVVQRVGQSTCGTLVYEGWNGPVANAKNKTPQIVFESAGGPISEALPHGPWVFDACSDPIKIGGVIITPGTTPPSSGAVTPPPPPPSSGAGSNPG